MKRRPRRSPASSGHVPPAPCFDALEARCLLSSSLIGRPEWALWLRASGPDQPVLTADLNGDTRPDLVAVSSNDLNYAINLGQREFDTTRGRSFGGVISEVAAGDLDGDGRDDVVVRFGHDGSVRLLLGTSEGTLSDAGLITAPSGPLTLLDTDGDGRDELVVRSTHEAGTRVVYTRYRAADGALVEDGTFELTVATESGHSPWTIGDVTGDGRDDALLLTGAPSLSASMVPGTAHVLVGGSWGPSGPRIISQPIDHFGLPALADVDGDGDADLVLARRFGNAMADGAGGVQVWTTHTDGLGAASFADARGIGAVRSRFDGAMSASGPYPVSLQIADADGDGDPEVLMLTSELYSPASRASATDIVFRVIELSGSPDDPGLILRTPLFSQHWADLDGDGHPDLAGFGGSSSPGVYESGSFYEIDSVRIHWNTEDNKPPVIGRRVGVSFTGGGPRDRATLAVRADDQDDLRGGGVVRADFWGDVNNNRVLDPGDLFLGADTDPADGWSIRIAPHQPWAIQPRRVFARVTDDQGAHSPVVFQQYVSPTAKVNIGGNLAINGVTEVYANIVLPGTAIRRVEFWRDGNRNGVFDSSDIPLGADTRAAGGWSVRVPPTAPWAMRTTRIYARVTDARGRVSEVAYGRYANPHPVAGTLTIDNAPAAVQVGQTIRLTARGVFDPDAELVGDWVYRYLFYLDTDHDGRISDADRRLGAGRFGDHGRRWWRDVTVTADWAAAAVNGRVTLLGTALDTTDHRSWRPARVTVAIAP